MPRTPAPIPTRAGHADEKAPTVRRLPGAETDRVLVKTRLGGPAQVRADPVLRLGGLASSSVAPTGPRPAAPLPARGAGASGGGPPPSAPEQSSRRDPDVPRSATPTSSAHVARAPLAPGPASQAPAPARPPPCGPGLLERSRCVTMHGRSAISPSHRPRRSGHPSCRMPPDLPYRRNRLCPSGSTIGVPEFQPARAAAAGSAPAPAASLTLPPAPSRPAPPRISIEIGRIEIRSSTRPTPTAARRVVAPRDHVIDPQLPFGRRRRGA